MPEQTMRKDGRIPTGHVVAGSIPEAFYKAMEFVHYNGYPLRTQYDRKNPDGSYLDPAGRDAKVFTEVTDPFAQPRFPIISYCEIGIYIAEILGVKDHLVVPYSELVEGVRDGREFEAKNWPYCYHQRLASYPLADGSTLNQLNRVLELVARDPLTRRAVATTPVPQVDLYMKEDQPCLREIQLRAIENESGEFVLNTHINWRSRDLFKAWCDNVIGVTNLIERLAADLSGRMNRKVVVGPYTECCGSLHVYGQDYSEKGAGNFFRTYPNLESFVGKAWTSQEATEMLVVPQLQVLKGQGEFWNFSEAQIRMIDGLIEDYETGRFLA